MIRRYSEEPRDAHAFTRGFDRFYARFAVAYDVPVKALPLWKRWLRQALPHLAGPKVLEVSFGTGWLMTRYASGHDVHGIDFNERMVEVARRNLRKAGVSAVLRQGDVESMRNRYSGYDDKTCAPPLHGDEKPPP